MWHPGATTTPQAADSGCFDFIFFLLFHPLPPSSIFVCPQASLLQYVLVLRIPPPPPQLSILCQLDRKPLPHYQFVRYYAVSPINVEILTSDEPETDAIRGEDGDVGGGVFQIIQTLLC